MLLMSPPLPLQSLLMASFLVLQMKKVFSANPEATINVECIMDDIDVAGRLSRDVFEEKSASVLERARAPLQKVMLAAHTLSFPACLMFCKLHITYFTVQYGFNTKLLVFTLTTGPLCVGFRGCPDLSCRCAHSRGGWWQL